MDRTQDAQQHHWTPGNEGCTTHSGKSCAAEGELTISWGILQVIAFLETGMAQSRSALMEQLEGRL
ncbi:Hypothetical predicted protein [Pelobates cultripes]|uniref:Uncharacterized protein n=1 Tax=Pelobates cultripes TaxID=61616 RepID=A0AAD1SWM1_PELCU|nr:Hypothetical predicted protein [Pelobates cultripes]